VAAAQSRSPIPPRRCVFCGGPGVTKQHVWPRWAKRVLPDEPSHHSHTRVYGDHTTNPPSVEVHSPQLRQGSMWSRQIRNVCGTCNGGWMSRLEARVKPSLGMMMLGGDRALSASETKDLSAWVCMTAIMAEFIDERTLAVPVIHRQILRETQEPPNGWYIWIAQYSGSEWENHYRHFGLGVPMVPIFHGEPKMNTMVTTFTMGSVMMHAFASSVHGLITLDDESSLRWGLRRIWPEPGSLENWKTGVVVDDSDASDIADSYFNQRTENNGPF
jgi:hypothetical protein